MRIPPVIQLVASAALAWLLATRFQVGGFSTPAFVYVTVGGAGAIVLMLAILQFRSWETTVDPITPSKTSTLVNDGIFKISRNPMYVGMALLLLAFCLFLGQVSAILTIPVFIASITRFQIRIEERALAEKFGDEFEQYARNVPRWIVV